MNSLVDEGSPRSDRRGFMVASAGVAGAAWAASVIAALPVRTRPPELPAAPTRLRPPGATARFLEACTGCNACVAACPPGALQLVPERGGPLAGAPGLVVRDVPCVLCEGTPCASACPTGALDPVAAAEVRIGLAALVDQAACLNARGLRCDVCFEACPLPGQAIALERRSGAIRPLPVVDAARCTGCGQCEKACVLETPAIRVRPITV